MDQELNVLKLTAGVRRKKKKKKKHLTVLRESDGSFKLAHVQR